MPKGHSRRQWESRESYSNPEEKPKVASYMIDPSYEGYLLLLQERNKIVKKLQSKDPKQIELERKEQGFSLYLNGANTKLKRVEASKTHLTPVKSRKTKTAAGSRRDHLTPKELDKVVAEEIQSKLRAKTAPTKGHRKNWNAGSVDIKTHCGEKLKVRAPVILTGQYDDDFEDDLSDASSYSSSSSGSEQHSDSGNSNNQENKMISRHHQDNSSSCDTDSDEGEPAEQIPLTIKDVKRLRESLEMNYTIQQNLVRKEKHSTSNSDHDSPIAEEEDDLIKESLEISSSSSSADDEDGSQTKTKQTGESKLKSGTKLHASLKADDVIVLEFSPSRRKERPKELMAPRKKDADSSLSAHNSHRYHGGHEDRLYKHRSHKEDVRIERSKELTLKPSSPQKKFSSALPASHKSRSCHRDDKTNLENVTQSKKGEHRQSDRQWRDSKSAPGYSHHKDDSPCPAKNHVGRPSSVASSWKEQLKPTDITDHMGGSRDSWAIPASSFRFNGDLHLDQQNPGTGHIESIVNKVLKLDKRGQRRLLQALKEIEQIDDSDISPGNTLEHEGHKSSKTKVAKQSCDKSISVTLKLFSNWGHPNRVGLTEVQFFDSIQNKIEINPDEIQVKGARHIKGDLSSLCNGKCKTIKERNMWSCSKPNSHHPICLIFKLQPCDTEVKDFCLGKIKIWNYNKNINDLSIGVCDLSIEVNGREVYTGQIDRGCGNQVFSYAKEINFLNDEYQAQINKDGHQSDKDRTRLDVKKHKSDIGKHAPTPIKINKNGKDTDKPKNSTTPTMDNVALFSNMDYEEQTASHSNTHLMNYGDATDKKIPAVDQISQESSNDSHWSEDNKTTGTKKPRESSGVPKSRHRKHKDRERRSKMAARLDGSESSIDSSYIGASASMDKHSTGCSSDWSRSSDKLSKESGHKSVSISNEMKSAPSRDDHQTGDKFVSTKADLNPSQKSECKSNPNTNLSDVQSGDHKGVKHQSKKKRPAAVPDHLNDVNEHKSSGSKPGSPCLSDEDTGSMLDQLRKITKDKKPHKGDLPPWLITTESGSHGAVVVTETKTQKQKDESLLDNWPTAGIPDLPTILDDEKSASPKPGCRPRSKNLPFPDLDDSSGRSTPNRMQEIEQKRNEWKRKEQFKLEESWTSLSLFDRLQKGRISLDLQKDVLDEYLSPEKAKPSEPTILEDTIAPSVTVTSNVDENMFEIPELPMGKDMVINILTTWGDHHYVGLNGIEVFTSTGELATVTKIGADPEDINILEGYSKDPRVVSNLIDGINHTRDDTHMWLAPFTKGSKHLIFLTFNKPIQIAMMRIWNYNKSRIHSYRGAKDIEITLDGQLIFKGEVTRACGGIIGGSDSFAETILFTTEEDILELVSQHDQAFEMDLIVDNDVEEDEHRPRTADETNTVERPFTSAACGRQYKVSHVNKPQAIVEDDTLVLKGQKLCLNFTDTWGDPYYLGLTGLEVVGPDGSPIPLHIDMVDADPRDLHVLSGYETDDRTLDKLLDGVNITTSDEHMWLVPYTAGEDHMLTINMGKPVEMSGLRIWNYNKSPEDTYRGAKTVHVTLDDCQVSPQEGFLLRKGPGNCFFDFAQEVSFIEPQTPRSIITKSKSVKPSDSLVLNEPSQEYEIIQKPCGFIYQFQLLSTWGDPYYVGLNGLEFYDSQGDLIQLEENNISAYPESVTVLEGMENDTRTPDKLIDGENDTTDGRHMWLAPVLPNILNRVYIIFDMPMEISMIKMWNYRKTPKRGVKDFALLVDDLLVYNGMLEMAEPGHGIIPTCDGPQRYHTILFTDNKEIQRREKHTIIKKQAGTQDVQLMNDREVVAAYSNPANSKSKPVDQSKRPKTSVLGWGRKR